VRSILGYGIYGVFHSQETAPKWVRDLLHPKEQGSIERR